MQIFKNVKDGESIKENTNLQILFHNNVVYTYESETMEFTKFQVNLERKEIKLINKQQITWDNQENPQISDFTMHFNIEKDKLIFVSEQQNQIIVMDLDALFIFSQNVPEEIKVKDIKEMMFTEEKAVFLLNTGELMIYTFKRYVFENAISNSYLLENVINFQKVAEDIILILSKYHIYFYRFTSGFITSSIYLDNDISPVKAKIKESTLVALATKQTSSKEYVIMTYKLQGSQYLKFDLENTYHFITDTYIDFSIGEEFIYVETQTELLLFKYGVPKEFLEDNFPAGVQYEINENNLNILCPIDNIFYTNSDSLTFYLLNVEDSTFKLSCKELEFGINYSLTLDFYSQSSCKSNNICVLKQSYFVNAILDFSEYQPQIEKEVLKQLDTDPIYQELLDKMKYDVQKAQNEYAEALQQKQNQQDEQDNQPVPQPKDKEDDTQKVIYIINCFILGINTILFVYKMSSANKQTKKEWEERKQLKNFNYKKTQQTSDD